MIRIPIQNAIFSFLSIAFVLILNVCGTSFVCYVSYVSWGVSVGLCIFIACNSFMISLSTSWIVITAECMWVLVNSTAYQIGA